LGGNEVNENWRKQYNKELMQLFADLDTLSFVIIHLLNLIGRVNRMGSTRKVSQVFNNNPQGSQLRGRPKNSRWKCLQTDSLNTCKNYKLARELKKQQLTGKNRAGGEGLHWTVVPSKKEQEVKVCIGL
jgi:hypothetical protein